MAVPLKAVDTAIDLGTPAALFTLPGVPIAAAHHRFLVASLNECLDAANIRDSQLCRTAGSVKIATAFTAAGSDITLGGIILH